MRKNPLFKTHLSEVSVVEICKDLKGRPVAKFAITDVWGKQHVCAHSVQNVRAMLEKAVRISVDRSGHLVNVDSELLLKGTFDAHPVFYGETELDRQKRKQWEIARINDLKREQKGLLRNIRIVSRVEMALAAAAKAMDLQL